MRTTALWAVLISLCFISMLFIPNAQGFGELQTFESPPESTNFGLAMERLGDSDGNGLEEIAVIDNNTGAHIYEFNGTWEYKQSTADIYSPVEGAYDLTCGDFNNDGYDDLVLGTPFQSSGGEGGDDNGALYIYLGSPEGLQWDCNIRGDGNNAHFGYSLDATDFNNDSYDDLIVGSPGHNDGKGIVYIFSGAKFNITWGTYGGNAWPNPGVEAPSWVLTKNTMSTGMGVTVRDAGDLDGNGLPDVSVGLADCDYTNITEDPGLIVGALYGYDEGAHGNISEILPIDHSPIRSNASSIYWVKGENGHMICYQAPSMAWMSPNNWTIEEKTFRAYGKTKPFGSKAILSWVDTQTGVEHLFISGSKTDDGHSGFVHYLGDAEHSLRRSLNVSVEKEEYKIGDMVEVEIFFKNNHNNTISIEAMEFSFDPFDYEGIHSLELEQPITLGPGEELVYGFQEEIPDNTSLRWGQPYLKVVIKEQRGNLTRNVTVTLVSWAFKIDHGTEGRSNRNFYIFMAFSTGLAIVIMVVVVLAILAYQDLKRKNIEIDLKNRTKKNYRSYKPGKKWD